ncbi:MAG: uncharacterized protein A8A55_0897 [Amphiamblys sp. WSBS2006]|nr:MAG: uncharacterized protein A8A55_0897 [Amphiamblys sp. WSBS2006]
MSSGIRPSTYAGELYPEDPEKLSTLLITLLDEDFVCMKEKRTHRAAFVPQSSLHCAGRISGKAYSTLFKGLDSRIKRIVIIAPMKQKPSGRIKTTPFSSAETPLGTVLFDTEKINLLTKNETLFEKMDGKREEKEFAVEIQLPLLRYIFNRTEYSVPILPLYVSSWPSEEQTKMLKSLSSTSFFLIVSDVCHYGSVFRYAPAEPELKGTIMLLRGKDDIKKHEHRGVKKQKIASMVEEINMLCLHYICLNSLDFFIEYMSKAGNNIPGLFGILLFLRLEIQGRWTLLAYGSSRELLSEKDVSVSYAAMAFTQTPRGAASSE